MSSHEKQSNRTQQLLLVLFCTILFVATFAGLATSYEVGPNYRNVSIDVTANITNARPEILQITLEDPVTLNAGGTHPVECNASIRDYNGHTDIVSVNGTFYHESVTLAGPANNNTHYFDPSCTFINGDGFYANYTCTFNVYYYANPDEWTCMVYAEDSFEFVDNLSNTTTVNELFALNVTPLIDYGDLAVEDVSENRTANVTNLGNAPINISVYGYGETPGDGLAMTCDVGSITIGNHRYSANLADDFDTKTPLTGTNALIADLTLNKQTDPNTQIINQTYWQLFVPAAENPFGECSGTVVFQAESSV